jgi:hypothetical protein
MRGGNTRSNGTVVLSLLRTVRGGDWHDVCGLLFLDILEIFVVPYFWN